jgi:hypothetical protein
MKSQDFRSNKDLVLIGNKNGYSKETINSPEIEIKNRNGREIVLSVKATSNSPQYLLLNESYSIHWKASIEKIPIVVEKANQWSMAVLLRKLERTLITLNFRYKDPLMPLGLILSFSWFALMIFTFRFPKND